MIFRILGVLASLLMLFPGMLFFAEKFDMYDHGKPMPYRILMWFVQLIYILLVIALLGLSMGEI